MAKQLPVSILSFESPHRHSARQERYTNHAGRVRTIRLFLGGYMEILAVCPANCMTGGPEAIHTLVSEMNQLEDVRARIWYWDVQSMDPCPEEYKAYHCEYVTEVAPDFQGVVIVPEIWANRVLDLPGKLKAIWWLGVDAYANWTPGPEQGAFLQDNTIIHMTQSQYAYKFLESLGVQRLIMCGDTVNKDFYEDYEETERADTVLYNPAKSNLFMRRLLNECKDIIFKPITGMTRRQVIDTMRGSKLYIDFGDFPGRERMPREAVLCGCCIITGKVGSAGHDMDFPHRYKFESKDSHLWAIRRKIRYVLAHYEECRGHFYYFRRCLQYDRELMKNQIREVADAFQYYHSSL